ncbi:MAG: hypothetical protein HKM23_07920 [Nitrosopumilus sp.]|nr:hypothetical protein [Nitrosopumilus sp.]NNL58894.1 hypothetical protein [Nitrosopumilus sp.]
MPLTVAQNSIEELETEIIAKSESKITSWTYEIFIWYADKTITENELVTALEYLIAQRIPNINSK